MSENTKIEWADHTFNPWIGCKAISPGCTNCYAAAWAKRYGRDFSERTRTKTWAAPLKWNAQHEAFHALHGRRQRVFCSSLADVFDNEVDPQWRRDLFQLICATTDLDWLLLTKRIGNAHEMIGQALIQMAEQDRHPPTDYLPTWPWPNVWLGATIANQTEADRDIPKLLAVPAHKRFLSMEPLLGAVDIKKWIAPWTCSNCGHHGSEDESGPCVCDECGVPTVYDESDGDDHCPVCKKTDGEHFVGHACPVCERASNWDHDYCFKFDREYPLDWVIVGGESGPGARPMHPDWARSLRDQCKAAGVPFLFKQWGEWREPIDGEEFDTSMGRAAKPPAFILSDTGTVNCFESEHIVNGKTVIKVGKKAAGRALDGVTHDGYPT